MLKASWGGGGRGMRIVENDAQLAEMLPAARREAKAAFDNDEVYLEKLVRRARHVEVQILGDAHGNLVHVYERDCTVQRRNQKVVERAPASFLTDQQRAELCEAALKIGRAVSYLNAGTVEFLQDADSGRFYFIEVNPRIQVEHTVTECATGIDLVKAQIRIADGARIGTPESGVPSQDKIGISAHALQCRVTTEDPENNFIPDYGAISAYRSPAGFGIRLDAGTAYSGAIITRSYDSLLVKVTAWSPTPDETIARMHRALWEFRIRGVVTNLRFLDQVITHPRFASGDYTTRFIDETPELFRWPRKRDRATRMLSFIGETIVNGNAETKNRARPTRAVTARLPRVALFGAPPDGTKQKLDQLGPEKFAKWMLAEPRVLLTDTTMRDAHQSLLATRMRTRDMTAIAPYYAHLLPQERERTAFIGDGGATQRAFRVVEHHPGAADRRGTIAHRLDDSTDRRRAGARRLARIARWLSRREQGDAPEQRPRGYHCFISCVRRSTVRFSPSPTVTRDALLAIGSRNAGSRQSPEYSSGMAMT
jgi:pyruvate carboxylase